MAAGLNSSGAEIATGKPKLNSALGGKAEQVPRADKAAGSAFEKEKGERECRNSKAEFL